MHLNKNFIILTFIFIYEWNKTFKILALAPNDLFKGKHICQAVIKVNPGHLSEPLWCKMDILSFWGVWAKTGASCEIVSHELSVSAYLKYPGRPNKCHTQEKFPLLSAHLQKLAINFDHSFPLWRAGGRIIFLRSTWCAVRLLKYYSFIIPDLLIQSHLIVVTLEWMGTGMRPFIVTLGPLLWWWASQLPGIVRCHLPGLALWR